MSKFKDEESREAFRIKIMARVIYAAECVDAALPRALDEPVTWEQVFEDAVDVAVVNGLSEQPFFKGNRQRFHAFLLNNKSRIRLALAEELGTHVEFGHGIPGVRKAGKRGIMRTAEWEQRVVSATADAYNRTAQCAEGFVEIPRMQLRLSLPRA